MSGSAPRGWHVVFGVLAGLTGVLIAADDGLGPARRSAAFAILAALCGWYAVAGGRALHRDPRTGGPAYVAVAVALTVALFAAAPVGAVMLFLLYPHIWALLPMRQAVAATVLALAATAAAMVAGGTATLEVVLVITGVGLVVALALGIWITRIIEQSRQRGRSWCADLAATRAELAEVSRRGGCDGRARAPGPRCARHARPGLHQRAAAPRWPRRRRRPDLATARHHIDRARSTARENLAEARALIADLAPPAGAARRVAARRARPARRTGWPVDPRRGPPALAVLGCPRVLRADQEVVLLRVAQEALANVQQARRRRSRRRRARLRPARR